MADPCKDWVYLFACKRVKSGTLKSLNVSRPIFMLLKLSSDIGFNLNGKTIIFLLLWLVACFVPQVLAKRAKITKTQLEAWIMHFEFLGTLIIGASVAGAGVSIGSRPIQVMLFNPWPGLLLISIAYNLKLLHLQQGAVQVTAAGFEDKK